MIKLRKNKKLGLALLALSLFILFGARPAFCLPQGATVTNGTATFSNPNENTLEINASNKAIINYSSFDVAKNETVIINLPSINNSVLNRVLGSSASQILGSVVCNGIFIIINEKGIFFGPNSNINVGSLIASTRDISDTDFMNSNYIFSRLSKDQMDALILNQGQINISDGGFGIMIAGGIENAGTIAAKVGTIALAAGEMVHVDISPAGRVSIAIDHAQAKQVLDHQGKPITNQIKNTGTLAADGGVVLFKASSVGGIFEKAINLEGYVRADKFDGKSGLVKVVTSGNVKSKATVVASRIEIGSKEEGIIPNNVEIAGGSLTATEQGIEILANNDITTQADITSQDADIILFADYDGNGQGSFAQLDGVIEATGTGNVYIDGSGTMTLGEIKTEEGRIVIGSVRAPVEIQGNPSYVHTAGDFQINLVQPGLITTTRADTLRYNPQGSLTLEATTGKVIDITNTPIEANKLTIIAAEAITINSAATTTEIYKTTGDMSFTSFSSLDNGQVNLAGINIDLTYFKANNLTLQSNNAVRTTPGIVIQGNEVKIKAQYFGTIDTPLSIEANKTYIQRLYGNIDIMDSLGLGSSILLRGPPDGFGAIIYSHQTQLFLEAEQINLVSNNPTYLYGNITFYNFNCIISGKTIYFEANHQYIFKGFTYIQGTRTAPILLYSQQENSPWFIQVLGAYDINRICVKDAYNLGVEPINIPRGHDFGNVKGWVIDPVWTNANGTGIWSDGDNWDPIGVPSGTNAVSFDGTETNDNCTIDDVTGWSGGTFTMQSDYTGTVYLTTDMTVSDFLQEGGVFRQGAGTTLTVTGDFEMNLTATWTKNDTAYIVFSPAGTQTLSNGLQSPQDIGNLVVEGGSATPNINISGVVKCTSLEIAAGHKVTMLSEASLSLTGGGTPLTGEGTLDVASHTPNTIQYTGESTTSITAAGPVSAYYNLILGAPSDSLDLLVGQERNLAGAIIDADAGYAYFVTATTPGIIIKVRLADLTRVGALSLNSDETGSGQTVIDVSDVNPLAHYAYFGTNNKIVKVRLSDFTRYDTLTLESNEYMHNWSQAAVIDTSDPDPDNHYAYFPTYWNNVNKIVKIRLSDFSREDAITIPGLPDEAYISCGAIDTASGFAYFGDHHYRSPLDGDRIIKVNLATFSWVENLQLDPKEDGLTSLVIDTSSAPHYAYVGTWDYDVVKIDLDTFTRVGAIYAGGRTAVIDTINGYYYATWPNGSGAISKIRLSDFTLVDQIEMDFDERGPSVGVIDPVGGYAYFGNDANPAQVLKVDLSTFNITNYLTLSGNYEQTVRSAVIDDKSGYAYFGTYTNTGVIIKVRLSDFTRVGALTLLSGEGYLYTAVIDTTAVDPAQRYAYFSSASDFWGVIRIKLSDFTEDARLATGITAQAAIIDTVSATHYAYFASNETIKRINLTDFATIDTLTLDTHGPNLIGILNAVIDTPAASTHYAYFAADAYVSGTFENLPIRIYKVDLDLFTEEDYLELSSSDINMYTHAMAIDTRDANPDNHYAYLGTYSDTAPEVDRIVKIGLGANFSLADSMTISTRSQGCAIDMVGGYLYFPAGGLLKIDLNDFTVTDTLPNVYWAYVGIIENTDPDPDNHYAYFVHDNTPGSAIQKVKISDFSYTGELQLLPQYEYLAPCAVIDTAGGYAYFGTSSTPGVVIKIRLSDFMRIGSLQLNSGEDDLRTAVLDSEGGFAYFGTYTSPGTVVKVRLYDLTRVDAITLNTGEDLLHTSVIDTSDPDPANHYAYFGTYTSPGKIIKICVDPINFSRTDALDLNAGEDLLRSSVIDTAAGYAYFGTYTQPGIVAKINLATFTESDHLDLDAGEDYLASAVIDTDAGYAYFGTYTAPGIVVKVDLSDFSKDTALTLGSGENYLTAAAIDTEAGYAYFGTYISGAKAIQVHLADLIKTASITLTGTQGGISNTGNYIACALIDPDNNYLYFGTDENPGRVFRVKISSFKTAATLDLSAYYSGTTPTSDMIVTTAVIDEVNGYAYFGTYSQPGIVIKVRLSDFTKIGVVNLDAEENNISGSVIDNTNNYAYFIAYTLAGDMTRLVKIDTDPGNFARVSSIELGAFVETPFNRNSVVIDTNNYYAYIALNAASGTTSLVKVDVGPGNFELVDDITLHPTTASYVLSGVIDTTHNYAYFNTITMTPLAIQIIKVNTDPTNFAYVDAITVETLAFAAVIDTVNQYAYFGGYTLAGGPTISQIEKVNIDPGDFSSVDTITLDATELIPSAAVIDTTNYYAYFLTTDIAGGVISRLVKINVDPNNFSRVGSITLGDTNAVYHNAVIDTANNYIYAAVQEDDTTPLVYKVSTVSFSVSDTLNLNEDPTPPTSVDWSSAVIDGASGYAYFGTNTSPAYVLKVRLSDFSLVGALNLDTGENVLSTAVIDTINGYAYFGTNTAPGIIVKVQLSTLTRTANLTLNSGEDYLRCSVIDATNGYAYFGTYTQPGIIVKVDLDNFDLAHTDRMTLDPDIDYLSAAAIDPASDAAYFATYTAPAMALGIKLSDFSLLGTLTMDPGEDYIRTAVIDTANHYVYFGTYTQPGKIIRVDVGGSPVKTVLTLDTGDNYLTTGILDVANDYAYFGTDTNPGKIIRIKLSLMKKIDAETISGPNLQASIVDTANGYAYFVPSTGIIQRMPLTFIYQYTLGTNIGQTLTVNGNLTINQRFVDWNTYGPAIVLGGNFTINSGSLWLKNNDTDFTWSPNGTKYFADYTEGGQNIGSINISGGINTPTIVPLTDMIVTDLTIGNNHTLDMGIYDLTSTGEITLDGGTLLAEDGNISANDVTINSGTLSAPSTGGTFTVTGNWTYDGGTFTHNSSTVTFNGSSNDQNITGNLHPNFYNLTITKNSGTVTVTGTDLIVDNRLILTSAPDDVTLLIEDNHELILGDDSPARTGYLTLGNNTTLAGDGHVTHYIADNDVTSLVASTSSNITISEYEYTILGNLSSVLITPTDYGTMLSIRNEEVTDSHYDITCYLNSNNNLSTLDGADDTLIVLAADDQDVIITLDLTGYTGTIKTGSLFLAGATVGSNGYAKLICDPDNAQTFDIGASTTFPIELGVYIDTNCTLYAGASIWTIAGNWDNYGTFNSETSTVTFDGADATITTGGDTTIKAFYDFIISSTGTKTLSGDLAVNRDLTISSGILNAGTSYISVGRNWDSRSGRFDAGTSTVDLTGTGDVGIYIGDINNPSTWDSFYALICAANGQTTSITSVIVDTFLLTTGDNTGVITDGGNNFALLVYPFADGDIFNDGGATIDVAVLSIQPRVEGLNLTIPANRDYTFSSIGGNGVHILILDAEGGSSGNTTYNMSGSLTVNDLELIIFNQQGDTNKNILNTNNNTLNAANIGIGNLVFNVEYSQFNCGSSIINISDSVYIRSSDGISGNNTINAGSSIWNVGGSWTNRDIFNAGTSTVNLTTAADAAINGSTTFYDLNCVVPSKHLTFEASSTQTVTHNLVLTGAAHIVLRSSSPGQYWYLDTAGATRDIHDVNVQDGYNLTLPIIDPYNSIDSGHNVNWFSYREYPWTPDPEELDQISSFWYEEGQKKRKRYPKGKYRTIVVVYEGKVVMTPYDETGLRTDEAVTLVGGQSTAQDGEVK